MAAVWVWTAIIPSLLGFYVFLGYAIGRVSGWTQLGRYYGAPLEPTANRIRFQSADLRKWFGYSGCLTFSSLPEGLFLAAPLIFRLGHPPLLFPWSEIHVDAVQVFKMDYLELRFQQMPEIPLRIRPKLAMKIQAMGGKLPLLE